MSRKLKDDLREIIVVVLGILIAFSLDGWGDRRAEARRAWEHLEALREDFIENRLEIDASIGEVSGQREAVETLRAALRLLDGSIAIDSAMVLMGVAFGVHSHSAVTKAYDDLIATGGLRLLEDAALRARLGAWTTALADVRRKESDNLNHRDGVAMGYLTEHVAWGEAAMRIPALGESVGPSRFENDLADLANDRGLDNLLATRVVMMSDVLNEYEDLRMRVDDVLESLAIAKSSIQPETR